MRAGGGNITSTHAEEISLCALFLMDASKKVDRDFNVHRSTAHTVRDAEKDIRRLTRTLLDSKVTSEDSGRNSPSFTDPTTIGHKKIGTTTWVRDTLEKSSSDDLEVEDSDEQLMDLNYELLDVI